jgi:carbon monoxide dehydrogenase subunit G
MTVEETIEIAAPREEVFDALMDPARLEDWVTTHKALDEAPEGTLEVGDSFKQKMKLGGMSFGVTWTVTELEAPGYAAWEGKGPAGSKATAIYKLAENGEGTRFDYTNEFDLPGGPLADVAAKAVSAKRARKEARKSLEQLKELLEG